MAPTTSRPVILRGAPYFPVPDVSHAGAYYREVLGFQPEYSAGEPPEFAVYSRNGCAVMFRRVPEPGLICTNEKQGGTWDAFFWVSDVEALYDELMLKGARLLRAGHSALPHEGVRRPGSERLCAGLRTGMVDRNSGGHEPVGTTTNQPEGRSSHECENARRPRDRPEAGHARRSEDASARAGARAGRCRLRRVPDGLERHDRPAARRSSCAASAPPT